VTEVRGARVLLRGARPDEIEAVLRRVAAVELEARDEAAVERKRTRLRRSGERNDTEVWFVVEVGGRLVGDIQGRSSRMAMPPGVWELGVELWEEADRGRGHGREACALLTSYLFEEQGAIRVQATTDLDNTAMRRTLETLGFGFEGTLRGFMPQPEGSARDYAMYGVTDRDWRSVRERWIRAS